jgi:hypothetical protein
MSAPKGYSSQEKEDRLSAQFQTIEPIRELQFGSSVVAHQFVYLVTTDSVEAGSTASIIVATGHQALKGDVIVFYNDNKEAKVWDTTPNTIILAETLSAAPAAADTFGIQRHKYPAVDSSGQLITSAAEVATAPNTDPLPALVKVVAGWESSLNEVHALAVDGSGILQTNVTASALPTGAATEATLATLATEATVATLATESTLATLATEVTALDTNGKVGTIETTLTALSAAVATEATLATLATEATVSTLATEATVLTLGTETTLLAVKTAVEAIENTVSGSELQVDVVTSALPSGAATEATLSTLATEATLSALSAKVIEADTDNVTIVSSVLPTGAATEATLANVSTSANQTNGSQKSQIVDGAGDIVDVVALNVALQATDKGLVTNTIIHGETTGGGGGYVDVKVTPSGAMVTEASISSIADVDGQQAMAASFPVVIASDQTAIPVTDNGSSLTVDGTVTVSSITNALPTGTNTIGKVDVNTLSVVETLLVDTASTTIFGNAGALVQVVASTASAVKKMQILDTTGAFIGLYVGPAASEVLKVIIGPGSDQTIEHAIPASSRITVRRLDSATNITTGILAINFIG